MLWGRWVGRNGHALPTRSLNIPSTERKRGTWNTRTGTQLRFYRAQEKKTRKRRYGYGRSRGYDTLNRSTSDLSISSVLMDAGMWRFVVSHSAEAAPGGVVMVRSR